MLTSDFLTNIRVYYDRTMGDRQSQLYNYYTGSTIPIDSRKPVSDAKAATHTNVHVDFFKNIIDFKVGYMGKSITSTVNVEDPDLNKAIHDKYKAFEMLNNMSILNTESISWTSTSGISHRLLFTENGAVKIKNILPWQVIYKYDHTPLDPTVAYYYYTTVDLEGVKVSHIDVYDKHIVSYYVKNSDNMYQYLGEQLHNFIEVPIIPIINNDLWASDCEKSVRLMDVYDEVISDEAAEVKALRLAYIKIWGSLSTGMDSSGNEIDINDWMKQTSAMIFGVDDEGNKTGDAEFLEKNINDVVLENTLDRYRTHIFETSGSVDLKEFANTERVFSIKAQMMRPENTAAIAEQYLRASLFKQNRLWAYIQREIYNFNVTEMDIEWNFKRTFPRDLASESTTLTKLVKVITLNDALTQLGWENAEGIASRVIKEAEKIEEEANEEIEEEIEEEIDLTI